MNYKIKSARFYQAVVVQGTVATYIQNPEYVEGRLSDDRNVKLSTNEFGLVIEGKSEITLVSWNNLSAVVYDKNAQVEAEQPKQAKQYKTSEEVSAALKDKKASKDSETVDFRKI